MFNKLDMLDRAPADGVVDAMIQCGFKPSEVSKINSPLLDGIWKGVTGRDPDGETELEPLTDPTTDLLLRLLIPRPFTLTLRWIITKPGSLKLDHTVPWFLVVCSSLGLRELVELTLAASQSRAFDLSHALCRAVINGRLDILHALETRVTAGGKLRAGSLNLLCLAARGGHLDMIKYLLHPSQQHLVPSADCCSAVQHAIHEGHSSSLHLLLDLCHDRLDTLALNRALSAAAGRGCVDVVQRLTDIARVRGVSILLRLSDFEKLFRANNVEGVRAMLSCCPLEPHVSDDVLVHVCQHCDVDMARVLLETLIAVDVWASARSHHLERAVLYGKRDLAMYLLERIGMRIWSDSAVRIAVLFGNHQLAESLLVFLAAHDATQAAHIREEVESSGLALIWSALDRAQQQVYGIRAAEVGQMSLVRLVVDDWSTYNRATRCVMVEDALRGGHINCARLLLPLMRGEARRIDMLESAALVRDAAMMSLVIDELIADGVINCDSSWDESTFYGVVHSIHLSAVSGYTDHLNLLLPLLMQHSGAQDDVLLPFKNVLTAPVHARCVAVAPVATRLLLCIDVDCRRVLDLIDRNLLNAVRSGDPVMVELLLNAGANVRHNANEALRLAESQGHVAMVELLKARGAGSG